MDFSDPSPYPIVATTDCSPINESFSYPDAFEAYFTDSYTTQPVDSLVLPAGFVQKYQAVSSIMLPAAANASLSSYRPTFNSAPFNQLEQFAAGFPCDPITTDSFDSEPSVFPHNNPSPTPSLCGDRPQPFQPSSPELSPRSLKQKAPAEATEVDEEPTLKRPQRKRGRPHLDHDLSDKPSSKFQRTSRLPHNQVERKYRDGLNSELERLRRAVPTLLQSDGGGSMSQPNPSKAMVLMGAIEHIKKIERERDTLVKENERLRDSSWSMSRRQDSASSVLMDS
jgi:hypothetical protein